MTRPRIFWLLLPFVVLGGCRRTPAPPATLGMWYWHSPFRVTEAERTQLLKMGVKTLYVRAGTFTTDGKHVSLMLPQEWRKPPKGIDIVLVFNFDAGLVSHLSEIPVTTLAEDVAPRVQRAIVSAGRTGIKPIGVQFDIDCPTSKLPIYTRFLEDVRQRMGNVGEVSITALPTWLTSKHFPALAKAVDVVAPQFYEGRTGKSVDDIAPISDPDALSNGLKQLERLGVPAYAGLATYGHALLFSPQGQVVGMYRGLSPEDALRHPSLRFSGAGHLGRSQEDNLVVTAVAPDRFGRGKGMKIGYVIPTAEMVSAQWDAFQRDRPANVRGAILYRFPEPFEAMALDLGSIQNGLAHRIPPPTLTLKVASRTRPFEQISDAPKVRRMPTEFSVTAEMGETNAQAIENGLTLSLRLSRPGVESVAAGDFDALQIGTTSAQGIFSPAPRAVADTILLRRHHALAHEFLRTGTIALPADAATAVEVHYTVRVPARVAPDVSGAKSFPLGPADSKNP